MKKPIAWHEENLVNQKSYLSRLTKISLEAQKSVRKCEQEIAFRKRQIARAKLEGKTEFDSERFKA